jgi:ATP-dependent Clp protease ATP-binding subunit ClpC
MGTNRILTAELLALTKMSEPKEFSKQAQRVLFLANEESKRLKSPHVASEHLLLGALAHRFSTVSRALEESGLTLQGVRDYISQVGSTPEEAPHGYGPSMRGVLRRSCQHSEALSHPEIHPEHLVLGLLDESEGGACRALKHFGVNVPATRQRILDRFR